MARWLILIALGLSGCMQPDAPVTPKPATAKAPAGVTFETHPLPMGQLTIIQVPVSRLRHATELQSCFLWREPGLASLQCPNDRNSYQIDPPP